MVPLPTGLVKAKIIDGQAMADKLRRLLQREVSIFVRHNPRPCLAVILVGDDPASQVYVRKKQEACEEVGILSRLIMQVKTHAELIQEIESLNRDQGVHGILVQLPLKGWSKYDLFEVFSAISPLKDVDVFHPENVGLLVQGRPRFWPCTPHAVQMMLNLSGIPVKGKHVVVISRSNVVGKPLSSMLIQDNDEFANATVTVCHDNTPPEKLLEISKSADIIVVAVGIPGFLTANHVRPGAVVIDVGTTRVDGKLVGDVAPGVWETASQVSRCPGGIGPLTVTMLLFNTLEAARKHGS